MTDIDRALAEARARAPAYGQLYGEKETSDDFLKVTYALLYESAPEGTVAERESWVRRQPDYRAAIERKRDAYAKWKSAETWFKCLMAEIDVYRTKQANNRFIDKAHT